MTLHGMTVVRARSMSSQDSPFTSSFLVLSILWANDRVPTAYATLGDAGNEYYAGGLDEEGRGSATVLIYPDEPDADANSTDTSEEPATEEKPSPYSGSGRKL